MLRLFTLTLALTLALGALPLTPAFADEEPAGAVPTYKISQLAPTDDEHPQGWSPVISAGVIPEEAPSVGALLGLARAAKIDLSTFQASSRSFQGEGKNAGVVVLVGLDTQPKGFSEALTHSAEKSGWVVRELGSPLRLAVAWGSSEKAATTLLDWQANLAAVRLCTIVHKDLTAAVSNQDRDAFMESMRLLRVVSTIQEESGAFQYLRGMAMEIARKPADALDFFRKSIKPDAPAPAPAAWQVLAAGRVGHMLLTMEDEDVLEEALVALELAVRLGKHAEKDMDRFGNHYNLACTYARLDRLDEAFRELEASLKLGKEALGETYADQYSHAKDRDSDMDPLREDPRFAALMKKYAPGSGD